MILCCALSQEELISKNEQIEIYIDRLSTDDISAMDKLYELIKTDVYAFALSKTNNPFVAEDLLHDTFLLIYKYAKRYIPQGKPLAWIFTIVNNLAKRHYEVSERTVAMDEESFESIPNISQFESKVIDNEFLTQLMKNLSLEEQQIIVLHIVSGLKHHEIARILNKPLSTVLSKYNRAIKKLQEVEMGVHS